MSIAVPRSVRAVRSRTLCMFVAQRIQHRIRGDAVVRRADDPHLQAIAQEHRGELGELIGRPALGRPVLRAGTQDDHRAVGLEAQRPHGRGTVGRVRHEHRRRRHRHQSAARHRQRGKAVDEARHAPSCRAGGRRSAGSTGLASVAYALGNAREVRHQRGLPRIGQDERVRVALAAQLAARAACAAGRSSLPCANGLSMMRRIPRMRAYTGAHQGGTSTSTMRILVRIAQERDQRLGQDRVADPTRRDDQDAFACHGSRRWVRLIAPAYA